MLFRSKIAIDRGLQPGTPQFSDFVTQAWQADQGKIIATQPGGGVAQFNPVTGRTEMVIVPNTGGYAPGAPVNAGGGVQEGATATNPQTGEKIQFRGGQWVPMGGGSGNATGGFRP